MKSRYLVTSGCSFTDNCDGRWPHYLNEFLDQTLVNYGYGSSGNDHICNSAIYAAKKLLTEGVHPGDIDIVVMWSGIERQGHFISRQENPKFDILQNTGHRNPVDFTKFVDGGAGRFVPDPKPIDRGWLLGAPTCGWENPYITDFKDLYFNNFWTLEEQWFKSLNYFLQLQWFCETNGIWLRNLTYKEILLGREQFPTATHLYDMVEWGRWIFYDGKKGLYEYARDHKLGMYADNFHPLPESHHKYVHDFLLPRIL